MPGGHRGPLLAAVALLLPWGGCNLPDFGDFTIGDGGVWVDPSPPEPDCTEPIPIAGAGYREGFEESDGGWRAGGENASWAWGEPTAATLSTAASGSRAWATSLAGDYLPDDDSFLMSPCFDASGAEGDLLLSFALSVDTEQCCDRVRLEYSVDETTWTRVSAEDALIGWHGSGDTAGWSGGDGSWHTAAAVLPGTAGQARLILRFAFSSDASAQGGGIGIDDVAIRPVTTDLEVTLGPGPLCGQAVASVRNAGGRPVTTYNLTTTVDGATVTETFDASLDYLDIATHVVGDGSSTVIEARVETAGDAAPDNDVASWTYVGLPPGSGLSWDLEADDGGFTVSGANPSWAWGEPSGEFIASAASGSRAWVTNPAGLHNSAELSYLSLPCLDLRGLTRDPALHFSHIFETETCCDEGWVELSIDGGSFAKLGAHDSGGNGWYNDTSEDWWDGVSGDPDQWREARHPLSDAAGHDRVRVRFVMSSDGSAQEDGFGVDDVAIVP